MRNKVKRARAERDASKLFVVVGTGTGAQAKGHERAVDGFAAALEHTAEMIETTAARAEKALAATVGASPKVRDEVVSSLVDMHDAIGDLHARIAAVANKLAKHIDMEPPFVVDDEDDAA